MPKIYAFAKITGFITLYIYRMSPSIEIFSLKVQFHKEFAFNCLLHIHNFLYFQASMSNKILALTHVLLDPGQAIG